MRKSYIFLVTLFFLISVAAVSQNEFIRGKVIDSETGETLIGVTVLVVGSTNGAITDFDGNYSISVDPGTYSVQVSYISYQTQTFENVVVGSGDVEIIDVILEEVVTQLGEVVVTATAVKDTEASLQIMQKKAAALVDGISARQMTRLGDSDAAAALKRVTGVSVQHGKYVFVRGLGDRYTKITLNGAEIPGLDPNRNTVQMDIFPSNTIENIIVHKTFTPDLPGESTGGHVDVITKDFPEQFTMNASAQFGYNPQANLNNKFLTYKGGKTDWLGFDDGTRSIPDAAQAGLNRTISEGLGQITPGGFTIPQLSEISTSFSPEMAPETKRSGLNYKFSFSVGNQTRFLGKVLGFNASLMYDREFMYYDDGEYGLYEVDVNPNPWKIFDHVEQGKDNVNISGLLNLNMKLNNNNKIGLRYLGNQSGSSITTYRDGYFYYEGTYDRDRNLGYLQRSFHSGQLTGKHVLPNAKKMVADWIISFTSMKQKEPDLRFFENLYNTPEDTSMRLKTNDKPARFFREMREYNINGKIDFELPITISDRDGKVKFGAGYAYKNRDLEDIKWDIQYVNTIVFTTDVNQFLRDEVITTAYPDGYYYTSDQNQNLNNSYIAYQNVIAGYGMLDQKIGNRWRFIGGIRLEVSEIHVNNKVSSNSNLTKNNTINEVDPLPSINLIYSLNENMNLRIAGSKTLARPAFREIGTNYYDYKTGLFFIGNQELNRSQIWNADIRWEWFFKPGEKIALSGFYKYFIDPIEMRLSPETQNYEIKFINSEDANLYGIEFEFRKKLDFVGFLRDFVIGGNFTIVESAIKLTPKELEAVRLGDPSRSDTRPMMGQAPYILNAYLGYDNKGIGLSSNIGFNVTGEKLLLITQGSTPYVYEQPFPSLNFNVVKSLGERFSIELAVKNILNPDYKAVHHFSTGDRNFIKYSLGQLYQFKLSYNIN